MRKLNKTELFNQAMKLHDEGKLDEADEIYQSILKNNADNFVANYFHGCVLLQKSQLTEAKIYFKKALDSNPNNYEANNNLGIVYKNLNDLENAKKYFLKATAIDENNFEAYFNCGNLYYDEKEYDLAVVFFDKAIACNKDHGEAHYRLGLTYQEKYRAKRNTDYLIKSAACHKASIICDPSHSDAHASLGMTNLWLGNIKEANKCFKKVCSLKYSEQTTFSKYIETYLSDKKLLSALIKHEYEQLTFIGNGTDNTGNYKFTKEYYDELENLYLKIKDNHFDIKDVTSSMKIEIPKILCNVPPKLSSSSIINESNDIESLESEYLQKAPGILVVDDFLNKEALAELQNFCLNANIFKQPFQNGYLGAFLSEGLSNEFILKLSEDLRLTYKNIFKDLKLMTALIFKYDSTEKGINIHADQSSVNVNIWVTPDNANMDKKSGGLQIWNKIPSADTLVQVKELGFDAYNSDTEPTKKKKFLAENESIKQIIPYRENRAIIFNSMLLHTTDNYNFRDNYEDRRINVTFFYD